MHTLHGATIPLVLPKRVLISLLSTLNLSYLLNLSTPQSSDMPLLPISGTTPLPLFTPFYIVIIDWLEI